MYIPRYDIIRPQAERPLCTEDRPGREKTAEALKLAGEAVIFFFLLSFFFASLEALPMDLLP
jgi:hypothetical protein